MKGTNLRFFNSHEKRDALVEEYRRIDVLCRDMYESYCETSSTRDLNRYRQLCEDRLVAGQAVFGECLSMYGTRENDGWKDASDYCRRNGIEW